MTERKAETPKKSTARRLKTLHKKLGRYDSLKVFARTSEDKEVQELASDWFFNKSANFTNPPQRLGNTKKKKK